MHLKLIGFGIPLLILAACIFIFSQTRAEKNPRPVKERTCLKGPKSCSDQPAPAGNEMFIENLSRQFISVVATN